jgi:hypothetical protein
MIYLCRIKKTNLIVIAFSCGQKKQSNEITISNSIIEINTDSLVNAVFEFGHQYFFIENIDSVFKKYGNPINSFKTQWCDGISDDSLLTSFEYSGFTLKFFEKDNSKIELESIYTFDKRTSFPANLIIGKSTRQDIIQRLGLPDTDHNDPGRSMTNSGNTTVYGTHS